MNRYDVEKLEPFGAVVTNRGAESLADFSETEIFDLVGENKVVVFRGFDLLAKQELALFAQKLGEPLQWEFGAINDLRVKPTTENYIFTDHEVPMHWDGAFAGKIPHIILFQCVVAPDEKDLGGTTFCDTTKIVETAAVESLKKWSEISVTYATKKIVHYGGKTTQKFLQKHPLSGETVIRYAEPVEDLNPVTLVVKGLKNQTQNDFVGAMKNAIYDRDVLYTHRWETGDIVLADNFALLHGREAFKNPNQRYIQRVNILPRPEGFSLVRFLKNSFTIRRKEFFTAELPIFLIPIFLSAPSLNTFLEPVFLLGLTAIFLLFNIGDMINCYADYELDAIYKSHLSNAVFELGKRNVLTQIVLSGIAAFGLTVWAAVSSGRLYLIPVTLVGLFIGLQYSIKPFKFKSRGAWQLLCLWAIIFFGPMLYAGIITAGFPAFLQLCLFSAYGFHQIGIVMLNTAEDYTEDKAAGLNTSIVALGLHPAMRLAWLLVFAAGIALQIIFAALFYQAGVPVFLYAAILIFTFGWLKIIFEYKKILAEIKDRDEKDATETLKKNGMKVPEWLKIGAFASLAVVLILFAWKIL